MHALNELNAEAAIQGTWTSERSVAVYEIAMIEGFRTVKGCSSLSKKRMQIPDTEWVGEQFNWKAP